MMAAVLAGAGLIASPQAMANPGCQSGVPHYWGGDVLTTPKVVIVLWGSSVSAGLSGGMPALFRFLTNSQWMDRLVEYFSVSGHGGPVQRGSYFGEFPISPTTNHGKSGQPTLTDVDIGTELAKQINTTGAVPAPTANTLYFIFFPPNFSVTIGNNGSACNNWGGIHASTTQTINGVSTRIPYAIVPDMASTACVSKKWATGSVWQQETFIASDILAETITDPFHGPNNNNSTAGLGWAPEIGGLCQCQPPEVLTDSGGNQFNIQPIWHIDTASCAPQKLWMCQETSNAFGTSGIFFENPAAAPGEISNWFQANACQTSPQTSGNTCQNLADIYGVLDFNTNFMPPETLAWYQNNSCEAGMLDNDESPCQRVSDDYGTTAGVTWGSAPSYVRTWWSNNGCSTVPHGISACQVAADLYGFAPGTTGFAPSDIQQKFSAMGCNETTTSDVDELCQNISNLYGTQADVTWGIAPPEAQNFWIANNCFDWPSCQGISDLTGATPSTQGVASSAAYAFYQNNGCTSTPRFGNGDICQLIADNFSVANTGTNSQFNSFGFLPQMSSWNLVLWWTNNNCTTSINTYHPRGHKRIAFTNGP
jgi:hypothetical protein